MSLTVNTKSYDADVSRSPDLLRYNGPNHSFDNKDYIDLGRTAPKPTSTFAGVARARAKLTRTLTDGTDAVGDAIFAVDFSIPVGASDTEVDALIDDLATWLSTVAAKNLVKDHDINQ